MVRHFRTRAYAAVAGAVALTMLAAACSNSSSSGNGGGSTGQQGQLNAGFQGLNPGTGAPQRGGTLNMVGISDVDYLDYDTGYFTTDYQVARLTVRQLYAFPADPAKTTTPVPDLATALPVISDNGLKQTVTLRSGVMWNTSPPRPVTVADVVRGIKRACNPSPVFFGGMADFEATIKGLTDVCAGYPEKAGTDAAAMKQYIEGHNVSGITTSGNTITFELTQPAPWLVGAMTMSPFSAVPIEAENALPGTPGVYNHMYSDGPYQITSYTPKKEFKFTRNPQWQASTDPVRKAYVNAINVDETGNQTTIYQQMPTNSPSLGMSFDALPPPADTPNLLNQVKSGSHDVNLAATYSSNPYLIFNVVSPNNGGALGKADVRQALSYGIQRSQLTKVLGGPIVNPALTHILPAGIDGSQGVPAGYNPYPYNQAKAKSMLASGGLHREQAAADQVPVPQRQPGQHGGLQQRRQPAERARLGEGDRRDHQPVGLLRQVPDRAQHQERPVARLQGHLGHGGLELGPGLVRELRGDVLQPAVLEPGRVPGERRQQLRLLLQHRRQQPDQAGAEPAHRGRGRQVLGPGRPAGHEGGGDLPGHLAAAAHVARVVRA